LSILSIQKKSRSLSDRSSSIGTLAEIISGMKSAITPHTETLLELFHRALSDPEYEVLSNAAFATGLLVEYSDVDLSPQLGHVLQVLHPLFINIPQDAPVTRLTAKDNATGAVGRIILRYSNSVPLQQVLPIFISALPLKNDPLENRPVFRALFHLFKTNGAAMYPYMDQLLAVFAYVLDPTLEDQIGDEVRTELIHLIALINQEEPSKVQAAGLSVFLPGA